MNVLDVACRSGTVMNSFTSRLWKSASEFNAVHVRRLMMGAMPHDRGHLEPP